MTPVTLTPISVVRSERSVPEDDNWDAVRSFVELDAQRFSSEALAELGAFSHVHVIFVMDQVPENKIELGARHPRNNTNWPKVGIFAQRGKNRPNRIGETICRLERIEGLCLHVRGLDAIDGSPVLDIKPWVREFGPRGEVRQPEWMDGLMRRYWD